MSDIQVLQENNDNTVVYESDIDFYLEEYCHTRGIEDMYNIPDQQWTAALMYICQHTFKIDNSSLKCARNWNGAYDLDKVSKLVDKYIYMCFDHNQKVSIKGFSYLSGIENNTIHTWKNGQSRAYIYYDLQGNRLEDYEVKFLNPDQYVKKLTTKGYDIYKKLINSSEQSLQDRLTDRRRNPMHTLPLWNAFQAKQAARTETPVIDTTNIAEQLGISDQLNALPGE